MLFLRGRNGKRNLAHAATTTTTTTTTATTATMTATTTNRVIAWLRSVLDKVHEAVLGDETFSRWVWCLSLKLSEARTEDCKLFAQLGRFALHSCCDSPQVTEAVKS